MPVRARKTNHLRLSFLPQIDTWLRFRTARQIKAVIRPRKKNISKVCRLANCLIIDCIKERLKVANSISLTPRVKTCGKNCNLIPYKVLVCYKSIKNIVGMLESRKRPRKVSEKKESRQLALETCFVFRFVFVLLNVDPIANKPAFEYLLVTN